MQINKTSKYLAIKVRGLAHWLWFQRDKTKIEDFIFVGIDGWGESGNHTEIKVSIALIEAEISSEALQYEN